jgi:hypothetical protein
VAEAAPRKAVVDALARWIEKASGPMQQVGAAREKAFLPPLPAIEYSEASSASVAAVTQSAPWGISAIKMGVWQIIIQANAFVFNLFYTSASTVDAGVLMVYQGISHALVNYANEMLWETFGAATRPLPPVDFPTAGIAAPGIAPLPLDVAETGAAS